MSLLAIVGVVLIIFTIFAHLKFRLKEFDISSICGEATAIVFVICFILLTDKYYDYGIGSVKDFWKTVIVLSILKISQWWIVPTYIAIVKISWKPHCVPNASTLFYQPVVFEL